MDLVTLSRLNYKDVLRLQNSAKIADKLEKEWVRKISARISGFTPELMKHLEKTGKPVAPDLEDLFCQHFFDVAIRSIRYAMRDTEIHTPLKKNTGLALPKPHIPESLKALMRLYDLYRKKRYKPPRAVAQAKKIKVEYLKRVSSVWEEHSHAFRTGDVADQKAVVRSIQEEADTTASRAKTIVRTETTNGYNKARKQFYDQDDDVTHYLFIAIRDAATSPWCSPLTLNGYRGRSGLVYAKSDPRCDKERPACHYGCRSEYLPLNRLNPAHLRFIQD